MTDPAAVRRAREAEMTEAERNASRRAEALRRIQAEQPAQIEEDPRTRPKAGPSEEEALTKGRERFLLERDRLVQKRPTRRARRRT